MIKNRVEILGNEENNNGDDQQPQMWERDARFRTTTNNFEERRPRPSIFALSQKHHQ
jgi:hypothetical protein